MKRNVFHLALFGLLCGLWFPPTTQGDTIDGSCLESWALENFQPKSPTYGQLVSSASYYGRTTVILLLWSG